MAWWGVTKNYISDLALRKVHSDEDQSDCCCMDDCPERDAWWTKEGREKRKSHSTQEEKTSQLACCSNFMPVSLFHQAIFQNCLGPVSVHPPPRCMLLVPGPWHGVSSFPFSFFLSFFFLFASFVRVVQS
ncbi:hypothetical protein TWF970_011068 [Orbilia oligospora]|uniref:Uncharacterized protein n=1 Tax=Orbilia oligospora TaxID=2813651 RepID=A0A7C8VUA2_ORBOL|nr:hypothetical protein TWF970_011068 [Orbilia oligospora]